MPQSVEAMEEEGERKEALETNLYSRGPSSDGRNHRLGLKMPSGVWGSEIGEAEEVERAREDDAREAVEA